MGGGNAADADPKRDKSDIEGMWRFGLRQALRLTFGLAGAFLLAAAVAALPGPGVHVNVPVYFAAWLAHIEAFARFNFGTSQVTALPAAAELARRLPVTLELVAGAIPVAVVLGIPLGVLLGSGRRLRVAAPLIQIVAAVPVFCASLGLIWLNAHVLVWHGTLVRGTFWSLLIHGDPALWAALRTLALPVLTVGGAGAAAVQLALRQAMSGTMEAPYRRGLRLMGLSGFEVDRAYLAPQILAGFLASLGEIALALFSAAAVAEWVFDWPGAAVLFVKSIALYDWSVAALVLLVFAAIKFAADFAGALGARALAGVEATA